MEYRKIKDLKELPGNPRTISDKQFDILVKSIEDNKDFFEARPLILSDRTGELVVLGGNQRLKAAKRLKLSKVPTYLIKDLTEEREKEITIRDNVSNGDWSWDIIGDQWNKEELEGWGLEIGNDENEDIEIKQVEITPYKRTHILISFPPERLSEIEHLISELAKMDFIEYEQSSN